MVGILNPDPAESHQSRPQRKEGQLVGGIEVEKGEGLWEGSELEQ